jgi:hypothetical protein
MVSHSIDMVVLRAVVQLVTAQGVSCWMHLTAVRLFVESTLRYGLPPVFQVHSFSRSNCYWHRRKMGGWWHRTICVPQGYGLSKDQWKRQRVSCACVLSGGAPLLLPELWL